MHKRLVGMAQAAGVGTCVYESRDREGPAEADQGRDGDQEAQRLGRCSQGSCRDRPADELPRTGRTDVGQGLLDQSRRCNALGHFERRDCEGDQGQGPGQPVHQGRPWPVHSQEVAGWPQDRPQGRTSRPFVVYQALVAWPRWRKLGPSAKPGPIALAGLRRGAATRLNTRQFRFRAEKRNPAPGASVTWPSSSRPLAPFLSSEPLHLFVLEPHCLAVED
jgi:hypothetical protein